MTGRRRRLDRKPMNIQPAGGPATWRRKPLAAAVSAAVASAGATAG